MKTFQYKAIDQTGTTIGGLVESNTLEQAVKSLKDRQYLVINVSEKNTFGLDKIADRFKKKKVSEKDVAQFTRLLATMLATGLPLTDAISNLIAETESLKFKEVLQSVFTDIQSGSALSEAVGHYPEVFDNMYVNLVKAGEASGKVDESLKNLAETMESNLEFKSKVGGALIYPAVIVTAMSAIGVFMITTIIPKISEVYTQFGAQLPLPTKVLIFISDLITHYTIFVLLVFGLLYYAYRILRKNPVSDYMINNALFKFPVMGPLNRQTDLAVINRTMGALLASGVSILDALGIVAKTVENNYFRSGLLNAAKLVEKGTPLSVALKQDPNFPIMMSQLMAIGEQTGTLDKSMTRLAQFYQESAETMVKTLTTLLEPIMILLMGSMVGGLALAVLLPMFNLVNVIH